MFAVLSGKAKVTDAAGTMTTFAGGRMARTIAMKVSVTVVDRSLETLAEKSEFAEIKLLLKINVTNNHQRNLKSLLGDGLMRLVDLFLGVVFCFIYS